MDNPKTISELINQAKKIDDNNFSNMEHLTSISILLSSNDSGQSKDKDLSSKFGKLNQQMMDINKQTSELLNELSKKHN